MFTDEVVSNRFKAISVLWCIFISVAIFNYTYINGIKVCEWEIFMIFQQICSWMCIFVYLGCWVCTTPSRSTVLWMKIVFLAISGPYLMVMSFLAFFTKKNLEAKVFILSFLTWWLFFSVSSYGTFKLALEISLALQRKANKKRLLNHFRSIDMRSYSSSAYSIH